MSIKTSKRIALGVIASLVFAPFAAIAPANAAITNIVGVTNTSAASLETVSFGNLTNTSGSAAFTVSAALPATSVGKALYTAADGYIGTIATLAADGLSGTFTAVTTTTTLAAAAAFVGTLPTTSTPNGITTGVINGMTVAAGSNVGLNVRIAGTPTAGEKTRAVFTGVGVAGTSAAAAAVATQVNSFITFTAPSTIGTYAMVIQHSVAGTFLTVFPNADRPFADITFTLTVSAAASSFSAGTSTAYMVMGNGTTAGTAATDIVPASGSSAKEGVNRAAITVSLNNASGVAVASGNLINVTVTGPGYVDWRSGDNTPVANRCTENAAFSATIGRSVTAQAADAVGTLYVCADGTSGTSSISITVTDAAEVTTPLATKTLVFYGPVAKLEVSSATYTVGRAGGHQTGRAVADRIADNNLVNPMTVTGATPTTAPAFIVKASDKDGNPATASAAPIVVSGDAAVIASGLCVLDNYVLLASSGNGYGYYNCHFTTSATSKSGDKATITIRIPDPADLTKFISTTLELTVGGVAHTHTLKLDKSTYTIAEPMVLTRSAVDASGNPVHDGAVAPAVIFTKVVSDSNQVAGASWYTKGTVATSSTRPTLFAPATYGEFEARMTGAVAGVTSAIVAKASVPAPVVPEVVAPAEKPTLAATVSGARLFLSGTAVDGEGDIIIYVKRVGTTAWKERAKTLEVAAPGDFNGSIKAPRGNVVIRVKQEGTGQFSNQVLVLR